MNDPILLGACIVLAMFVGTLALGIYGVICVIAQVVRECKRVWKLHKNREA